jgi:two-component system LytT family response regulator
MIVDDERLARVELIRLMSKFDDVEIVAQASSAKQALKYFNEYAIDLVFLDIQMPQMTGLELASQMSPSIQFVFCTAFNEHAVDAFTLNAADYLVKPVNPERLAQTLDKIRQGKLKKQTNTEQLKENKDSTVALSDGSLPENHLSENYLTNNYLPDNHGILLKFGGSSKIVRLHEIERFESIGNHVAVYCQQGKSFIHSSLSKIENRLDPTLFFKASRSDIIRIDNINKIEDGMATGSLLAIMNSGQHIEVSRRQSQTLKQAFNVW